jgi:choline dehydrogenase-like flavoprotein
VSRIDDPSHAPQAFMADATQLAERFAAKVDGEVASMFSETLLGSPSTAHILGGACMGDSAANGVIDHRHQVFGYDGLYVIDGSAVSANPVRLRWAVRDRRFSRERQSWRQPVTDDNGARRARDEPDLAAAIRSRSGRAGLLKLRISSYSNIPI